MGWIGQEPKHGYKPIDYVLDNLLRERVLDASVKTEKADDGRTTRHVVFIAYETPMIGTIAVVGFVEQRDGLIWVKAMDESVGPYHSMPCPKKIMKRLSPYDPGGYATAWRKRQQS